LTCQLLRDMAAKRQQEINADHPTIQEFWDIVDFIDGDGEPVLNHSRDDSLYAINLNHFAEVATERRQIHPPLTDLKRLLKSARNRKFIDVRTVYSTINAQHNAKYPHSRRPISVKCWIFAKENGV
ncbi:MAG: hypothetical protein ACRCWB_08865, partial [Enterovibrio sp.]